jgi:hypothetical protein
MVLSGAVEVTGAQRCTSPVGEVDYYVPSSGAVSGPYAGTFDGGFSFEDQNEGGPLRRLQGDYTLTGAPGSAYEKARITLDFDSGVPSSCAETQGREAPNFDVDVTADYSAYALMDDGSICVDSGEAGVSATGTAQGDGTATGSMTVTLGPPPVPGSDASCSQPEITLTPSTGLPRKRSQRVDVAGTGFAPNQYIYLVACNAYTINFPSSCQGLQGPQADGSGAFSATYFSGGVNNPTSCDETSGPCYIVALDQSINMSVASAEIRYAAYPTVSTIGPSTMIPDTLEVTGVNLDEFRWLDMRASCAVFAQSPLVGPPVNPNVPGVLVNEWSNTRISITWPAGYLNNSCGRHVQWVDFSDDIRETLRVPTNFNLPAVISPDTDGDGVFDDQDNCPGDPNPGQANQDGDNYGDACDPDDDEDGVADVVDSGGPAGTFADNSLVPPTTGQVIDAAGLTVGVEDASDSAKGVSITTSGSGGPAILSVCGGYELEVAANASLVVTCHSVEVDDVTGGPVAVTVPGGLASVSFPAGTKGTVDTTPSGGATVTGVAGAGVTLTVGGSTAPIGAGGLTLIAGTSKSEKLDGTSGDDVIVGNGGNDQVAGKGGNDTIVTGAGNDKVDGGTGDDTISAGNGSNNVDGGAGNDQVSAGTGNDNIDGGAGNDTISAGNGNNSVAGGDGNDQLTAGTGNDNVDGGAGSDTCAAGGGTNKIKNCEG